MKKFLLSTMVCMGTLTLSLIGCQSEDLYVPGSFAERYANAWAQNMGAIDSTQTFNLATAGTAEVSIAYEGNYTLRFYSANPKTDDAYLLGEFEAVGPSTSTYSIDMLATLDTVYVALFSEAGGHIMKAAAVENSMFSASFGQASASTRSVTPSEYEGKFKVEDNGYFVFPKELTQEFLTVLPENGNNLSKSNITTNFSYKATKGTVITIRPMYTVTSENRNAKGVSLGLYWYDDYGNKTEQLIWNNIISSATSGGYTISAFAYMDTITNTWSNSCSSNAILNSTTFWNSYPQYRCEEIKVTTYSDMTFGFYIETTNRTHYTESDLNLAKYPSYTTGRKASTFDIANSDSTYTYLGFEDWYDNSDLNDLIVQISGVETQDEDSVKATPQSWILACEDLGNADDFDFNDVVMSVTHVSGQTTAEVVPLAAGGSRTAYVYYGAQKLGEIHDLLGASNITTLVNTRIGEATGKADTITLNVSANFSLAADDMGGFKVGVIQNASSPEYETEIAASGAGKAPQIICIPGDWKWPIERTSIVTAYPDFDGWMKDKETNTTWYNNPVSEYLYPRSK